MLAGKRKSRESISVRLILVIIGFSTFIAIFASAVQLFLDYRRDVDSVHSDLAYVEVVSLRPLSTNLWNLAEENIQQQLDSLINHPGIDYAAIRVKDKIAWDAGTQPKGDAITAEYPLLYERKNVMQELGRLQIVASLSGIYQQLVEKALVILGTNFLKTLIVATFMYVLFHIFFTRHLEALSDYARNINLKDLAKPLRFQRKAIEGERRDEFTDIADAMNEMQTNLKETYDELVYNKDRLRGAIESLQEGFALFDADDRLVAINDVFRGINPKAQEFLDKGASFEDVLRANVAKGRMMEGLGREEDFIRERMEQHRNPKGPIIRQYNDGRWFILKETKTPEGGTALTFDEITGLKKAETALRESEERFRDVAESAGDWIWEMDADFRFTYLSPRYFELNSLQPEEVLGKKRWEVAGVDPEKNETWREHKATLEAHQAFRDFEFSGSEYGDEVRFFKISGKPVFGSDGTFRGYRGAASDVTEARAMKNQLDQAAKLATLGEMATSIAHEINQPLNIIRMKAELGAHLLEKGSASTDELKADLTDISNQIDRAATIMNHILEFGRNESEKLEAVSVPAAVDRAISFMSEQLKNRNIALTLEKSDPCRPVMGVPVKLEQVVLNLLANARDAITKNGEPGGDANSGDEIIVQVEDLGAPDGVRLVVRDTGGGIPEAALANLFDPFFTTKEVGEGTGLGLSISYGIVDAMGGTLKAANIGNGAQFTVELPVVN